jgi:predicted chitinase
MSLRTYSSLIPIILLSIHSGSATSSSPACPKPTPNTLSPKTNEPTANSTLFTEQDFVKAVTALGSPAAQSKAKPFIDSLKDGTITTKREAAMFLAQLWHESMGLEHKEEIACKSSEASKAACDKNYPLTAGKGKLGKHYYGRGYIQLTWDYNYEKASLALFNDTRLLDDPDSVAKSEELAWRTAAWYWKGHVHEAAGVKEGKFGATTMAINGALECSSPQGEQLVKAKKRFEYYKTIMKAIGETGTLDETGCYS